MFEIKDLKVEPRTERVMSYIVGLPRWIGNRRVEWVASCKLVEPLSGSIRSYVSQHYDLSLPEEEVHRQFMEHVQEMCKTMYSELTQLVLTSLKEEGRWEVENWIPYYGSSTLSKLTVRDTQTGILWTVTKDSPRIFFIQILQIFRSRNLIVLVCKLFSLVVL